MKGFFEKIGVKEEFNKMTASSKKQIDSCEVCGLYKSCNVSQTGLYGKGKKEILFITTFPKEESIYILEEALEALDIVLKKDCWVCPSIQCHPEREPSLKEVTCCQKRINKIIKKIKPKKIIPLGKYPINSLLLKRMNRIGEEHKWVGFSIPDYKYNCWVFPNYSLETMYNYDLDETYRNDKNVLHKLFRGSLKKAIKWKKPLPEKEDIEKKVTILTKKQDVISCLKRIKKDAKEIAFDYETTGLKPYKKGHKIVCMSIAVSSQEVFSFPVYKDTVFLKLLKEVLTDKSIKKIAQNVKFEDIWTRVILGYKPKGWVWDTMVNAHIIDNRTGITGLKFQAYIRYGILGYDQEVERYIKGTKEGENEKDGNRINLIENAPLKKLLLYCGLDSLLEFRLYEDQKKEIKNLNHSFFLKATKAFSDIQKNGIYVDKKHYIKEKIKVKKEITALKTKIRNSEELKKIEKFKRKRSNLEIKNVVSDDQLRTYLFKILKKECVERTEKGLEAVSEPVLHRYENISFIKNILQIRKLNKLRSTYIESFLREEVKGKIHPFFDLNRAVSFRSNSSNPNFQNIPVRDETAGRIARKGIIARPGEILLESDYSGLEVVIGACHHKDKNMIKYLLDPKSDMHRDTAKDIFLCEQDEISKMCRFYTKNGFVFPQFYGSYYKECAKNMWETITNERVQLESGVFVLEHFFEKGIICYEDFEEHLKSVEDILWNKRFYGYKKWKEDFYEEYCKKGYFYLKTGFKCSGFMKKNQVVNYPIQGSAFHCLLWSLVEANKIFKRDKCLGASIAAQIHDSLFVRTKEEKLKEVVGTIKRVSCVELPKAFEWITLPLNVEIKVGKNWHETTKLEID